MDKTSFLSFVSAINSHDADKLHSIMTDDHVFIDSHGNQVKGRDNMKAGWQGYFKWFPDYKLDLQETYMQGDVVTAFGFAEGSYQGDVTDPANHWKIPVAIRAVVDGDKVKQWQVYADTKIPFDIINKANKQ